MAGIVIGVDTSSAFTSVEKLTKSLGELGKQGIVTESEIKKLTEEAKKKFAADDAERAAAKLGNTLDRVAKTCGLTAGQLSLMKATAGVASTEMTKLGSSTATVSSAAEKATSNLSGINGSMSSITGKIGALAAGFLSLQTAMQAVTTVASMQAMKASFDGIFGERGPEQFKYIIDSANKYGKSIDDVAGSYKKFAAAADFVGISSDNVRKIFESTTQAITKVGGTSEDVSGALLAISQSLGKGVVMSEEFKGQFAERIPGAMKIAADALGVTSLEFQKMMESGEVVAAEFWPKIAAGMENFSQGWQKSSDTMVSNFERVKNSMKELAATDVAQGTGTFLGKFFSDSIIQRVGEVKEAFRYMSVMARTMNNMQTPELPQFSPVLYSIDELEAKLARLDERKSGYIKGLQEQVTSLSKTLVDMQTHQIDFGPSGENVDVMRQKLKWFQDLLLQLTGQTYTVNVTANVEMSQLKQAQSYVNELIKNTATAKSQAIDTEKWKLDNTVNEMERAKKSLETKISNPNADLKEKNVLGQQLEEVNKGLDKTKIGYEELDKQQKKIVEGVIAENSEVKKLNKSKAGTSESDLTHGTQRTDAAELSVAKQVDAYSELKAGLIDLPGYYAAVGRAQEAETVKQGKITKAIENEAKARKSGGNAGAKAAERSSSYLEQAQDQYDQLVAQMGGDALGAKLAAIEKKYDKAASSIRQAMIGAKGGTEELTKTLEVMGASKAIEQQIAKMESWKKSMQDAANLLSEMGRLSGDPQAAYAGATTTNQVWEADQQRRIQAITDETEREKQLGELRQVMALKELDAKKTAYEGIKAVSSEYWNAEKKLIEANLEKVKASAQDETAYKIYAAQQWDEFYKAQMESQAANAGSFAETLSAKWSLAFGGYKSETTKAKDSWNEMSDGIINASEGMVDGVAGGFGDMIRNIGNGTASIEDMWKNMLSRMLDMFASFVEDLIKSQLKKMIGGLFADTTTNALSSTVSSVSNMRDGGTGSTNAIGSVISTGKSIGKGIMSVFSSGESESTNFLNKLSDAAGIEKTVQAASTSGYTALTSGASQGGALATGASNLASTGTSLLSTIGSTLGVIGAIGGVVGIVASLFGDKKEEVKKTASGYTVNYAGGKTTSTGIDFYSDGSTVGTGPNDPDVTKKISDAFKEAAENLADFADVLGFTVDVLDGFQMPSMDITSDQLDGYIRNGTNAMAFQALEQAGLRGAFDKLAEDGEVYIDEVERLATAYSAGSAKLSAYGYDMADVAQVTTAQIEELRAQTIETAAGTAQATMLMAESMGATSDQLAELAANASDGSQALAVTDEQLSNLLEADWVSKVEDAVGGEDAFNGIMDNLIKNVFDSVGAYAENLDFYGEKASTAITKLNDASITVDNFWEKFNDALKSGMDPDTFELWSKASTWVNSIDSVNDALEQWNRGMLEMGQALDARMQSANGYDYQATLTKQLAAAEKELYDARENGYDAAYIAKLQTVQSAEMVATTAKHQQDYADAVQDAQSSIAESSDDNAEQIRIAMEKNQAEYRDYEKEFTHAIGSDDSLFRALEEQYAAEIGKMVQAVAEGIASAIESLNLDSREATVSGKSDLAGALDKVAAATKEYADALKAGVDQETLARLVELQQSELEQYWASVENSGITTQETLKEIRDRLSSSLDKIIATQTDAIQVAREDASSLASAYHSAANSIADTLKDWNAEQDPTQNAQDNYYDALADFNATFRLAMKGDTAALSDMPTDAVNLKDAASKYFGEAEDYSIIYRQIVKRMEMAEEYSNILGDQQDTLVMIYDIQLNLYALLKEELLSDDPNTEKLQAISGAIGTTNGYVYSVNEAFKVTKSSFDTANLGIGTTNLSLGDMKKTLSDNHAYITSTSSYAALLNDILKSGAAKFPDIVDAINKSNPNTTPYLTLMVSNTSTMNNLLGDVIKELKIQTKQSQVDAAYSLYQQNLGAATSSFQSSGVGAYIQAIANSGAGWEAALGNLSTTGYSFTNGQRYIDWAMAGNQSASELGSWYTNNYGTGSGYVDWNAMMNQWYSTVGGASGSYNQSQSAYQTYLRLVSELRNLGGYADGGISTSPALTWVSEGAYSTEAHIPMPNGKTIPVTITEVGGGSSGSAFAAELKALREEVASMRAESRSANVEKINHAKKTTATLVEWKVTGMPATQTA